jgi:WD40 repeat protein
MFGWQPRGRLSKRWHSEIGEHVISLRGAARPNLLAAAAVGGPIKLFDASNGALRHELPGHGFGTAAVDWSGDGAHLASVGQDGKVIFWDLAAAKERLSVAAGAAWAERLAWHPTEPMLATAAGRIVRLWDAEGRMLREWKDHSSTVSDLAWRPGTRELTASAYGNVILRSPEAEAPLKQFVWKGSVLVLCWSPDGNFLATGDQDATVHFWLYRSGQDLQMSGYALKVRELSWDATSRYLATGGGPAVTIWDCGGKGPAGTTPVQLEGHEGLVTALAYQGKGSFLASGGEDGKVCLWQPGKVKKPLSEADVGSAVVQLLWGPDDRTVAAGTEEGRVVVFGVS